MVDSCKQSSKPDSNWAHAFRLLTNRQLTPREMIRIERETKEQKEIITGPFTDSIGCDQKTMGDQFIFKFSYRGNGNYIVVIDEYTWASSPDYSDGAKHMHTYYHQTKSETWKYGLDGKLIEREILKSDVRQSYETYNRQPEVYGGVLRKALKYDPPGSFWGKKLE